MNREAYREILLGRGDAGDLVETLQRTKPAGRLAFSGGTDSLLLRFAFSPARIVTLSVVGCGRDSGDGEIILVDEEMVLSLISEHKMMLKKFPVYTQRILAVCELFLCRSGTPLMTGHGPEAVFGGFRRRGIPDLDRVDETLDSLFVNVDRLAAVAAAAQCELILPFLEPAVFSSLVAHRRVGLSKEELYARYLPVLPPKASLQNGSGVHYLFARMAKRKGFRFVKEYFESLLA